MADCNCSGPTGVMGARFRAFCQRIIPAVYDDSLSYVELICKLMSELQDIVIEIDVNSEDIDDLKKRLDELERLFEEFQKNGFKDTYMELIEAWLQENMWCIMSWGSRIVWFGISDDGYFEAFIPDNFNFLNFDVIMDSESPDYGKLVMSYCQEVYEPCEISCWSSDCPKPQTSQLPIMPAAEAAAMATGTFGTSGCGCGSRKGR